ncbi:MAG: site-specific integrase [Acidimicrobiales bacterium]|jgi:integrase
MRPFGSVRLRGRLYEASYWHNGRRHVAPTTFATKGDARAFLSAVEADIRRGAWIDPSAGRLLVWELAEEWLESNPTKRESTTAREELTLRLHILPTLGEQRLERVGPPDIQRLVKAWSAEQAPRTVKRNYEVVRAMFGYAVRNDWLARNPCRNVHLPSIEGTRRFDLTPEDVTRIAAQVAVEYRPMVWIGAVLGLRWSEVAALRVGRLDLSNQRLTVAEAVVRGTGGRNVFGPPKSKAGRRTMFMPTAIADMLQRHLEHAELSDTDTEALVFTDDEGGALRYSNWRRRVWVPAVTVAGCEGAGFHDLRRLNATTLVVEGIDVKTAQTRLGHADPRVTLSIYASAPASVDRAAADVVGERFFGGDSDGDGA